MRKTAVSVLGCVVVAVAIAVALATPAAVADSSGGPLYRPSDCQKIPTNADGAVLFCQRIDQYTTTYVYPGSPQYLDTTYADRSCDSGFRLVAWNGRVVQYTDEVSDYFTKPVPLAKFLALGGNNVEVGEQMVAAGTPVLLGCL